MQTSHFHAHPLSSAIRGQGSLLDFGFQSTYSKLKDLCVPNARLLDGRSDLAAAGKVFDPPESRYRESGSESKAVTELKCRVIETFHDIEEMRTNFRLGHLLAMFKQRAVVWTEAEERALGARQPPHLQRAKSLAERRAATSSLEAKAFVKQATPAAADQLYAEFEALFPGGTHEAAKLDFSALCDKPDLDEALVDCIM